MGMPFARHFYGDRLGKLPITLSVTLPISPTNLPDLWPMAKKSLADQFYATGPWWCTPVPSLMKIHPGVLEICVLKNKVKIAYLDQVHWPLTFGESRPKSIQFIYSWWCIHVPSLMKIHPGVLEILCYLKEVKIAYIETKFIDLWPLT